MAETPSGKDKITRWTRVFYGGYELSGDARTAGQFIDEFGEADITGWNEGLKNYLSDGYRRVGVTGFQCLMNDTTNRSVGLLQNPNASNRLTFLFGGGGEPAIPDLAYILPAAHIKTDTGFDNSVGVFACDFIMDQSQWDANTSNPQAVTLSNAQYTATTNGGSHDNGAGTTAGWHANLHITAQSSGNYAFTIDHSTNDSDWSTLGTFVADGSAVTSEHLSGSGTVNQYVRFVATRTAGTVTAVAAFARN